MGEDKQLSYSKTQKAKLWQKTNWSVLVEDKQLKNAKTQTASENKIAKVGFYREWTSEGNKSEEQQLVSTFFKGSLFPQKLELSMIN